MKTIAGCLLMGLAVLIAATGQTNAQVTINFDNLPCNTYVTTYPDVTFSSAGGYTPITYCNPSFNYGTTFPTLSRGNFYGFNHFAELTLNFIRPVRGLTYYTLASDSLGVIGKIDVYRSGIFSQTLNFYGNGNPYVPIFTDLRAFGNDITRIRIYNITDAAGLVFDNFNFTPFYVDISNERVGNIPNASTQYALLGADVSLQANGSPTGGSYSWTFTGPYSIVGGSASSSSVTIRSTNSGTITAVVNYTSNGVTTSARVTINTVIPTLSSFTANAVGNVLDRGNGCSGQLLGGTTYTMGCYQGGPETGIVWSATAQIPNLNYLSDPAQSGIKFKNGVSIFSKRLNNGRIECRTLRTASDSGWALDTSDPYNHQQHPPRFFNQGVSLQMGDFDAPGTNMDGTSFFFDAKLIDDQFETYVFYFTGNPSSPTFEYPQPLRLTNSQFLTDRIVWRFGGTAYFDSENNPVRYREVPGSSTTTTGFINATGTNTIVNLQRTVTGAQPPYSLCAGAVNTTNPIDGTRYFVHQQYADLLGYEPDADGWDFWTYQITRCVFDINCIYGSRSPGAYHGKRTLVAYDGFFKVASFNQTDPAMANPPGSPGFNPSVYNPAFVQHCYLSFLRRNPDEGGFNFWLNNLSTYGDYAGVIDGFVTSPEYRQRFGAINPQY